MWFFRFAIILLEFLFIFYYTAVVFQLLDYYVLDALDSNKDITLTSILGVEVSRCNDLTKEQLEQVFDYLVEKELE